ncbi:hypothetical protein WH96_20905, partial [Kiloniella spongiae]
MGVKSAILPLNAIFPPNLFQYDLKSAAANIKDQLLANLHLNLNLPTLRFTGMPSAIALKNASFKVTAPKLQGQSTREIYAGITGTLEAKISNQPLDFNFYILAEKPGSEPKPITLRGDTKSSLNFASFRAFTLNGLNLIAEKSGNGWSVSLDAQSKLNNKDIDVSASVPPAGPS